MVRQGGLGRGLASLIPQRKKTSSKDVNYFGASVSDDDVKVAQKTSQPVKAPVSSPLVGGIELRSVLQVPVENITPNPRQPRKHFDENKLQELADSIKQHGLIQPLLVSRNGADKYELIAGERRLEASKIAGLEKVPVLIRDINDGEKLELALIENIQRHNLNPIEEAEAYKQLQDEFVMTQEEIAKKVGKSRSAVTNTMRLLNLPIEMKKALVDGRITEGHARMILAISNPEKQRALFEMILKDSLSVRQVEEKVREVSVVSHQRRIKEVDPEIKEKENQLGVSLGTRVKIKKSKKGGQILIDFYSEEEMNNLCDKLVDR